MISLFKKNIPGFGFDAFGYPLKYRSAKEAGLSGIDKDVRFFFERSLTDRTGNTNVINYGLETTPTGVIGADGCYAEIPAGSLPDDVLCDNKPWTVEIELRCTDVSKWTYPSRVPFGRGDTPGRMDIIVEKDYVTVGGYDGLEIYHDFNNTNWHTIKITHTENNVFTLFVDGIQSESTTYEDKNMRENTLWIGWDGSQPVSGNAASYRYLHPFELKYIRISNTVK